MRNPMDLVVGVGHGFDNWQQRHRTPAFLCAVVQKFNDDQAGSLVALLSYYAFLAVFPLLLILVSVTGIVLRADPALQRRLVDSAFSEFPIIGTQIHQQLGVAAFGHTGIAMTVGILGALWGTRGFVSAVQNTLNTLWAVPRVDRPDFLSNNLRMLGVLAMMGLWVVLTAAATAAQDAGRALGISGEVARVLVLVAVTAADVALLLGGFRLATASVVPTRAMIPGAIVAAIAWQVLTNLAGFIVAHNLRHAQAVAGLFGLVLGLLSWFALQATLTVYAIEADVVRSRHLWPRALMPPPLTDADKAYLEAAAKIETRSPDQHIDTDFD